MKYGKAIREIPITLIPAITADIHEFAPDFILRAVLIKTAVVGSPPVSHDHMFARLTAKTSLSCLCLV